MQTSDVKQERKQKENCCATEGDSAATKVKTGKLEGVEVNGYNRAVTYVYMYLCH